MKGPSHLLPNVRVALLASLLALPAVAVSSEGARPPRRGGADLEDVRRTLTVRHADDREDARSEHDIVLELVALGPDVIPELVALVNGRATRRLQSARNQPPTTWVVGPDRFADLARAALARLPRAEVLRQVQSAHIESDADRVAALSVLAELRSAHGLTSVFEIASGFDPLSLRSPTLRGAFEDALATLLVSDSDSWSRLRAPLERLRPDLLSIAANVVMQTRRPEGIAVLVRLLGRDLHLDEELLPTLAELAAQNAWRASPITEHVRAYLDHERSELRVAAVQALGRLAPTTRRTSGGAGRPLNTQLLHELIGMTDDPDALVARAAHEALRRCCRAQGPKDAAAWRDWLAAEEAWWIREQERLAAALTSEDPAGALAAVRELGTHPALAAEIAPLLTQALARDETACALAACAVARELGVARSVPALEPLLFDTDEAVQSAAWDALRELTGADLPRDGLAWSRRLHG